MEINEALEKFTVQLEANGRSQHTISQYRRHISLFSHWMATNAHSEDLSKISHEDIAAFFSSNTAKRRPDGRPKKPTSVNALRTSIRCFFEYLHESGIIAEDPTRLTRRAICSPPPPHSLSDDEVQRLMEVLKESEGFEARRDHVLFRTMLGTGIRLGSAVALNIENIDFENGVLWIHETKGKRPEKVFINTGDRLYIRNFIDARTHGPLFTNLDGRRLSQRHVQRRFTQWLQKTGITRKASCHSLRHSFAVRLYQRTHDLFLVQQALRHRSITSTVVYSRVDDKRLREAIEA